MTPTPYLNAEEAAGYLRLSPVTLEKLRVSGKGPAYRQHGDRRIVYKQSDLDRWSDGRKRLSTSDRQPLEDPAPAASGAPSH